MVNIRHVLISLLFLGATFANPVKEIQPARQNPANVVFLGDSITYFWIAAGYQVWAEYYLPLGALNTGWPGDWTTTIIDKINGQGLIDNLNADLAVLMIGTNDLGGGATEQSVADNIRTIIDLTRQKNPNVKVLLLGVLPRNDASIHEKIRTVNTMISKYEDKQNVFFLDMEFEYATGLGLLKPGLFEDGLHLNANGYALWAQTMNPLFNAILNGDIPPPVPGPCDESVLTALALTKSIKPQYTNRGQVVFLGDSITDFFDSDGIATWNEFYAPLGAVDTGVSGDWTTTTIDRINNQGIIDNLNAYLAVLKIGTNDLSGGSQELTIANNILTILNLIKSKNPGVRILLLGILPRNGEEIHQRARNVNSAISSLADNESVWFLDMDDSFADGLGVVKPGLYTDGLHLTAQGYAVWAETMNPLFDQILHTPFDSKVVMLGDSLSDRWQTTGAELYNSYYVPIRTTNFAISGHTSTQTLRRIEEEGILDGINAKVVTLLVGGNDLTSGSDACQVVTNIVKIIGHIQQKVPHGRILLIGLLPAGGKPDSVIEQGHLVNDALALLENGNDIRYLDMRTQFADANENIFENLYEADLTHLSVEGYAVWKETMDPLFLELLQFK